MLRLCRTRGVTAGKRSAGNKWFFCGSLLRRTPTAAVGRCRGSYAKLWGGNRPMAPARRGVSRFTVAVGAGRRDHVTAGAPPHRGPMPERAFAADAIADRYIAAG